MSGLQVPVLGTGIEALDSFLASDRSPPESMALSDLDGFLTGIAIGPELVMPSEWMPIVWGGEEPLFNDGREAQAVLGGIMSRYNEIILQVRQGTFEPILGTSRETVIASDWATGFILAMTLRHDAWAPLVKSKHHALLLFPIVALGTNLGGGSLLGLIPDLDDEIISEAPAMLPDCVMGIAQFWRERRPVGDGRIIADRLKAGRRAPKPGRNAVCPCGSGKKYKKCCGRGS